ncbi:hypothetical protein VP02_22250 [Pseudomonas ogarae]|uniref:Uncharacterized protein n=1 Tax=Pseudomonas kilonensis TaxID=132476 RepID=A0A0F4XHS5_9PSED|nr:hypothetical protein VP02_22250 [Pseudomonas ogarae]
MRGGTLLAFIQEKPGSIAGGAGASHMQQAGSWKLGRWLVGATEHLVGASLLAIAVDQQH